MTHEAAGDLRKAAGIPQCAREDDGAAWFADVFREALLEATRDRSGELPMSRSELAVNMGVSVSSLEKWAAGARAPASAVVDMLCGDAGLPAGAWRLLADRFGERGGFVVVERAAGSASVSGMGGAAGLADDIEREVLDVAARLGELAASVRDARARDGDGGAGLTPAERLRLRAAISDLEREAADVRVMLMGA